MNDPMTQLLVDISESHANIARSGMVAGEEHAKRYIRAVVAAYERALEDPVFQCPIYLHAAIEGARRYSNEASVNAYANAMVKRDRECPKWERDSITGAKEPE